MYEHFQADKKWSRIIPIPSLREIKNVTFLGQYIELNFFNGNMLVIIN